MSRRDDRRRTELKSADVSQVRREKPERSYKDRKGEKRKRRGHSKEGEKIKEWRGGVVGGDLQLRAALVACCRDLSVRESNLGGGGGGGGQRRGGVGRVMGVGDRGEIDGEGKGGQRQRSEKGEEE